MVIRKTILHNAGKVMEYLRSLKTMARIRRKPMEFDPERKTFKLPHGAKFDNVYLPVIQNGLAMGLTEGDLGMLVGYQGSDARNWLGNLKKNADDELKLAVHEGQKAANTVLVSKMFKAAIGYDYEEKVDIYEYKPTGKKGRPRKVKVGTKIYTKHQPGNAYLATFLSENRMPELFKRHVEITRRNMNFNVDVEATADQISSLAGKVVQFANERKQVESIPLESTDQHQLDGDNQLLPVV